MANLKDSQRKKIQELYKKGHSIKSISRIIKCERNTVKKWCYRCCSIENKKVTSRRGRYPLIGKKQMGKVKLILLKNKYEGTRKLLPIINQKLNTNFSDRSLRRYSKLLKFKWGKYRIIPILTEKHKKTRLEWAEAHVNTDWKDWIFSDEKTFRCGKAPRGLRYIIGRRPCIALKTWSGKINVWWGIHFNSILPHKIITGNLNGEKYIDVLSCTLNFSTKTEWILQQDNARPHVAKKVKNWMSSKEINVCCDWPPYSPDLNPIENLWSLLDSNVNKRRPKNNEQLIKNLSKTIKNVDIEIIENLILSMPKRIEEVIKLKGGFTKY